MKKNDSFQETLVSVMRVLGSRKSPRKTAAVRENGRKGGRPASGVCSERELKRRLRLGGYDSASSVAALNHRKLIISRFHEDRNSGFAMLSQCNLCPDIPAFREIPQVRSLF